MSDVTGRATPSRVESGDPGGIANFRRFDARLTTSGQPSAAQLGEIAALGVGHVINLALHTHEQALVDEAATVAALGMTYTHIPVEFDAPTDADFAQFCDAMAATGGAPVHVHCIVNARVTAFVLRWARDCDDVPAAQAMMDSVWRPGGVWAAFLGDDAGVGRASEYAGRDY